MSSLKKTTVFTASDIEKIVAHFGLNSLMDRLIESLTSAFQQFSSKQNQIPIRSGFHYNEPNEGLLEWMPLFEYGKQVVIKVVGYHPENPKKYGMPTIVSTLSIYDPATGHLKALMDGIFLTAFRTGAASAVASQFLAMPESRVLGVIGCGAQSITQIHALSRLFRLERVLYYDISEAAVRSFVDRCSCLELGIEFQPSDIQHIVEQSDIISTATSIPIGAGPLFQGHTSKPHLHINAVGSDFPGKFELPKQLLTESMVCPDFKEQAIKEGECQQLDLQQIGPDLAQIVRHPEKYQFAQKQRTVFDSTGFALEDHVAAALFLDCARQLGLGTEMEIEDLAMETKNPYYFVKDHISVKAGIRLN